MFWLGLAVVAALTLLAWTAAVAVCGRARFAGRAETATAAGLACSALILAPIYALGFASKLTAPWLAVASAAVSGGVLYAAGRGRWREVRGTFVALALLPFDGLRMTWRARSFAFLGLAVAGALIAWTTFYSYWVPSWRDWDGLWYHEPIIGFTIQNHGFAVADLPWGGVQKINGYPRVGELNALWFAIFTGRRLVDVATCLVGPFLLLATYALARRYSENPVTSIGWATALFLMPAATRELQSVYVDLHYAWALVCTALFALRPVFRPRDALFCALAVMLLLGTKGLALFPAPIFLLIALGRLVQQNPGRPWVIAGVVAFAFLTVGGMFASIYLRNFLAFKNPFWPDLKLDIPKWNIHFPGIHDPGVGEKGGRESFDLNEEWGQFFEDALSSPYSWHRWHYGEIHDFGMGVPWVIWPITAFAMVAVGVALVRSGVGSLLRKPEWIASKETFNVALLIVPIVVIWAMSPARWSARYHIATTGLMIGLCAWASGRRGFARLGEGAAAAAILGALASNYWASRCVLTPKELGTLMKIPYPEREVTPGGTFSTAYFTVGSCVTKDVGLARDRELGKGDVLAFPDNFGNFPAIFWNDWYSNRAVWIPEGPEFIANAEKANAKWIYVTFGDANYSKLKAPGSGWQEVGTMNVENWGAAFRRAPK